MAKFLTREAILNCKDIKTEEVYIREWGGNIIVKGLSAKKRAQILQNGIKKGGEADLEKLYPMMLIASVVDEKGNPVFEEADKDLLNEKAGGAVEKIAQVAMRLSGMQAGAVEAEVKN